MRRTRTGLTGRKALGRTFLIILATVVAASGWLPRQASGQQIIEIDASVLGGTNVSPQAINNAGQVVGSFEASNGVTHAFIWKNGVMVDIESVPTATSTALAINDAGVVVGQTTDTDGDTIAFRWEAPGPMARLTVFDGQSIAGRESTAQGINNNGVIVGYARAPSPLGLVDRAYRMTGSGPGLQIGGLNVLNSRAFAINDVDQGQIVGQSDGIFPNLITQATFWNPSPIQLDTATSLARAVNNSGKAVGERGISPQRARLWQLNSNNQPSGTSLNPLPGHTHSAASGIRDDAGTGNPTEIVGVSFNSSTEARAVRWLVDAQGTPTVEDLNTRLPAGSGWVLQTARAINDRGQIVGTGTFQGNAGRGYLFDPQEPEPEPEPAHPAVLFLHGILASHLYQGPEGRQVWPPTSKFSAPSDLRAVTLTDSGKRLTQVLPKEQDIVKEALDGPVLKDFGPFMDRLKALNVISDWYAYAYDWRLSWSEVVEEGTLYRAQCFIELLGEFLPMTCAQCQSILGSTACVRLEDAIHDLANAPGNTNQEVWIVAHSMGGLITKTLLTIKPEVRQHLAGIIFVGSPQIGTPESIAQLLHGEEMELLGFIPFPPAQQHSRPAIRTWPSTYQLLPFMEYFNPVRDPVLVFKTRGSSGSTHPALTAWNARYGGNIADWEEMEDFLLGRARFRPAPDDVFTPEVVDQRIFDIAVLTQKLVATFVPHLFNPPLPVFQLVGWGLKTVKGIEYMPQPTNMLATQTQVQIGHKLLYTCDGDATVVVPSAAAMQDATTFYLNLRDHNRNQDFENKPGNRHRTLLDVVSIQQVIRGIVQGGLTSTSTLPAFMSTTKPSTGVCDGGFLRTRSPAEIHLFQEGRHTGPSPAPSPDDGFFLETAIPNSDYKVVGEGREALVDGVGTYEAVIEATGTGTVTVEGGRFVSDTAEEVFEVPGIPILKGSRIEFTFDPTAASAPPMTMDVDGDGIPDLSLSTGAPPGPEVFLQVLSSALDKLGTATAAADLPGSTLRALREEFLQEAHRALADASEDLPGKPRRLVAKLEQARKALRGYINHLEREVARGRVGEAAAQPLTENAAAIVSLVEIAQERLVPPLGHMEGEGRVHAGGLRYDFEFEVRETGKGKEEGRLTLTVRTSQPGRDRDDDDDRDHGRHRSDRFETTRIQEALFTDDPDLMPGGRRTKLDTMLILGEGRWNGRRGYTFEATATDAGEPGAAHDSFAITIRDPGGVVVTTVRGLLTKGNNQAKRPSSIVGHLRD